MTDRIEVIPHAADAVIAATLSGKDLLEGPFLQRSPLPEDALRGTLLSLPGVVQTPVGLSIRGGRPNQSSVQIATVAVVEPATGMSPLRVPVGSVATFDFLSNPHPVEFGGFSSGVTLVTSATRERPLASHAQQRPARPSNPAEDAAEDSRTRDLRAKGRFRRTAGEETACSSAATFSTGIR